MSREPQRLTRLRIAQAAARLMAEHGIKDHALAKRKAARQLGVETAHLLPRDEEIDQELHAYLALFQPDTLDQDIELLRRQAVDVMDTLADFQPLLTGPLAQGVAAPFSDIELEVYADSSKEFEQFLLNRNIDFKTEERRNGSFFTLFATPADVIVHVLPEQSSRSTRASSDTRKRLNLEQLRGLLPDRS